MAQIARRNTYASTSRTADAKSAALSAWFRVVVVHLEKEWVSDVHFELAQIVEREVEVGVLLRPECNGAEVAGEVADL